MPNKDWYDDRIFVDQSNRIVNRPTMQPGRVATAPIPTAMNRGRTDRRRETRCAVDDPGWLRVLDPLSLNRIEATVIDVSKAGIKLRLAVALHVGTTVQVHLPRAIVLGEVRHCVAANDYFLAGIFLTDVCATGLRRDVRGEESFPVANSGKDQK